MYSRSPKKTVAILAVVPRSPNPQPRILFSTPNCLSALVCACLRKPHLCQPVLKSCPLSPPTHRFFIESALWYCSLGKLDITLKALQRVAQIDRKQREGAKLSVEVRILGPSVIPLPGLCLPPPSS